MLDDLGHPFARGEPVYDVTFENVQAGPAHRLSVPPRQPAWRHRARHRRPLRAGAGLVHLRRRRSDVALQRQCRRAEDADPAPDPLGDRELRAVRAARARDADRHPGHGDLARARAGQAPASRSRAPRPRSAPTSCRTSTSTTRCATASGRRRSPSWRCMPGAEADRGDWPPGFPARPAARLRARRDPPLARASSSSASSPSASSSARPCRTAPRSRPAAPCRRAATGAHPRTATPGSGWKSWSARCRVPEAQLASGRG